MDLLLRISRAIDRLSEWMGRLTLVLMFAMVLVGAYNAIVRYISRFIGTISAPISTSSCSGTCSRWCFVWGQPTCSPRTSTSGWIFSTVAFQPRQSLGGFVRLRLSVLPICGIYFWYTYPAVQRSWSSLEASPDPSGLPRYPIKTVVLVAFGLLALQGIAEILKNIAILVGAQLPPPLATPSPPIRSQWNDG